MAILKRFLSVMVIMIVVLAVVGLFLPERATVSRSIVVERSPHQVFVILNSFSRFNEWSPWAKLDPETVYTYDGPTSGVGAKMTWRSEMPSVGNGSQEITESVLDQRIGTTQVFGDMGMTEALFTLEPTAGGTRITWGFSAEFGYNLISRYAGLLFDNMVGQNYELGLANLKALIESEPDPASVTMIVDYTDGPGDSHSASYHEILEVEVAPGRIAYFSAQTGMSPDEMSDAMSDAYARVFAYLGENAISPTGPPISIGRLWDEENGIYAFDAGVPVPPDTAVSSDLSDDSAVKVSDHYSGPALKVVHVGPYSELGAVHEFFARMLAERGLQRAGDPWEEYFNRPGDVAESELVTHVYYPIALLPGEPRNEGSAEDGAEGN